VRLGTYIQRIIRVHAANCRIHMGIGKAVGKGFTATSSILCLFITATWLPSYVGLWPAMALLAVLGVPFILNFLGIVDRLNQHTSDRQASVKKAKVLLMALQGLGFACWFFDVLSTVFQINILQNAFELNFLGWPLSALGALLFYLPMVAAAYYLLYRAKTQLSFYVTVVLSVLVLFMGALNFNAAMYNFGQAYPLGNSVDFVVVGFWVAVTAVFALLNFTSIKKFAVQKIGC
jgi:hypothetical protein